MEYMELIQKRHSVRDYSTDDIDGEKIEKILESARIAPTAANRQPFKVYVVHTKGREEDIRKIYNRDWFVKAPIVLCVCSVPAKAWVRSDGKNYSDVDAAIVMDHMVLAAADLGLGTCWIGAFDPIAAKEILKMEDGEEPVVFTPLGYGKPHEFKKTRKSIDEIVIER